MRDWSDFQHCLNEALVSPSVKCGSMDAFPQLLPPGAFMEGVDFQDCSLRWLVAPECRHSLGARRPISGGLGVYSCPLFGVVDIA